MWSNIWHTFFFDPIYNLLVFLIDIVPGGDVGISIILAVVIVKLVLLPLSVKAVKTQVIMRELDPKLKALKEKYKDDKEKQAKEMMALYKDAGLNPFASVFVALLQIPLVIALYFSVSSGGGIALPAINTELLYSFVPSPEVISMMMFGTIDIAAKSLPLALLAGIAQFFQAKYMVAAFPKPEATDGPSFKADFQRSMQMQMRYVLPVIIFFVAYTFQASLALYFFVSSLFAIGQEVYLKRHR